MARVDSAARDSSFSVRRHPRTIARMSDPPIPVDVEGPVQAEVFVVWLHDDRIELTGPCGSAPWMLEIGATEHPVDVVSRIVRDVDRRADRRPLDVVAPRP